MDVVKGVSEESGDGSDEEGRSSYGHMRTFFTLCLLMLTQSIKTMALYVTLYVLSLMTQPFLLSVLQFWSKCVSAPLPVSFFARQSSLKQEPKASFLNCPHIR